MAERNTTLIIISDNGARSKKFTIPVWVTRTVLIALPLVLVLAVTLILDYRYVVNQIFENRELQAENRRLRQNVQTYKSRLDTLDTSMERIQSFATRLRIMTNLEDRENVSKLGDLPIPYAHENLQWKDPALDGDTIAQQEKADIDQHFSSTVTSTLKLEQDLIDLYELLSDQKSFLLALPSKRPALGPITSGFGVRYSPFGDGEKMHEGIDIANSPGSNIRATAQGTVIYAGVKPGYGQTVIIDHGYGIETWYSHASKVVVKKGQPVKRGQQVALMGSSGRSTGSHVHYEIRVHGWPVDPFTYILEN